MMFPLVVDLAADRIPVAVTCRVLGFSKQAFDQWRANPLSQRDWDDAHLSNAAIDLHHHDPEFGYRFITDELAGVGITARRNRVNRLCTNSACSAATPANVASTARQGHPSTTTSSPGDAPPQHRTGCG
jgi:putative transposase